MDMIASCFSFCTDSWIPSKTVTIYAKDKSWSSMKHQVQTQCKIKHKMVLSRKVIKNITKSAIYEAGKPIRRAKPQYQSKLKNQFSTFNTHVVWQGLLCITHTSRNLHLQTLTPSSQINWITYTASSIKRTPPKLPATLALSILCTQLQVSYCLSSLSSHGRWGISSWAKYQESNWPWQYLTINTEVLCRTTCPTFLWNIQLLSQPMQSSYLLQDIHHHSCLPPPHPSTPTDLLLLQPLLQKCFRSWCCTNSRQLPTLYHTNLPTEHTGQWKTQYA